MNIQNSQQKLELFSKTNPKDTLHQSLNHQKRPPGALRLDFPTQNQKKQIEKNRFFKNIPDTSILPGSKKILQPTSRIRPTLRRQGHRGGGSQRRRVDGEVAASLRAEVEKGTGRGLWVLGQNVSVFGPFWGVWLCLILFWGEVRFGYLEGLGLIFGDK